MTTTSLGRLATALARHLRAVKVAEGPARHGNRSRYYHLPATDRQGRPLVLRISDHSGWDQGRGVAHVNVIIDDGGAEITARQVSLAAADATLYELLLDRDAAPGPARNIDGELIDSLIGCGGDDVVYRQTIWTAAAAAADVAAKAHV